MSFIPDFQQLRKALLGGQPDRVPLLELAIANSIKERFIGKPILSVVDKIEFFKKAGYDYIRLAPKIDMNPEKILPGEGARISNKTQHTSEREWHASGVGIISTIQEFEKFHWAKPEEIDYSEFEKAQSNLPDNMKIICQYGDIFTWVWDFMGFETFSFALIENPKLVELMFNKIGSIVLNLFETCLTFDNIGALFYSDDIAINSGLFVSPKIYKKYLFPWMRKIGNLCQKNDIPFIFHSDGNIWDVMDDLKDCGINALQPLEPQAIDIVEVKQKRGKEFCLVGNIDVDLLARGTPEAVRNEAKRLLKLVAPGGGFCLGSGNTVPDYAKYENYLAMIETAKQYGKYPINLEN